VVNKATTQLQVWSARWVPSYQTARFYNLEDHDTNLHRHEHLKS
jgi:hypothetical protein